MKKKLLLISLIFHIFMWNAIVRKVQSFFQPQQSEVSKLISQVKPATAQQQQKLSQIDKFLGEGPVKDSSAQLKTSATIGGTSGGGSQPPPTGGSDSDLTRGKNVGDKITIGGRTYKIVDPSRGTYEPEWDSTWNDMKTAPKAPTPQYSTPVPTPVPTPVQSQPQIFDMGALQRKLQSTASSIGQGFTKGAADLGAAIQRRGVVSAGDRGSETITKQPSFGEKALNYGKNVLGAGGEFLYKSLINPSAAATGSWGTKDYGASELAGALLGKGRTTPQLGSNIFGGQVQPVKKTPPDKTVKELPETPENIFTGDGGTGAGAGAEQPQLFTRLQNQEVRDMILQELMNTSNQIANMPTEDLDAAYTKIASELGVTKQQAVLNDLNTQVLSVTDEIEAIDGQVTKEAGNVLMTEDQRRRLISARAKPLREQLVKLMRSAQYAGVGLDSLMKMLNDRMGAKKDTITTQRQAAQMAQSAEEARKNRLLGLLPYVKPTAQKLSTGKGYTRGGGATGGGADEDEATAAMRAAGLM